VCWDARPKAANVRSFGVQSSLSARPASIVVSRSRSARGSTRLKVAGMRKWQTHPGHRHRCFRWRISNASWNHLLARSADAKARTEEGAQPWPRSTNHHQRWFRPQAQLKSGRDAKARSKRPGHLSPCFRWRSDNRFSNASATGVAALVRFGFNQQLRSALVPCDTWACGPISITSPASNCALAAPLINPCGRSISNFDPNHIFLVIGPRGNCCRTLPKITA
jgi:hypothetical protein